MIITGTLITFVVGGGVFIFWPDLKKKAGSPKEKKIKKIFKQEVQELYDSYFPQEELFIEAIEWYDAKKAPSLREARSSLNERGQLLKAFLTEPQENKYTCPICERMVLTQYNEVDVRCTCSQKKIKQMVQKLGYPLW